VHRPYQQRQDVGSWRRRATVCMSLSAMVLVVSGCASSNWVTLRKTPHNPLSGQLDLLSLSGPKPTSRTMQLLRRYDLVEHLTSDRDQLLKELMDIAAREPNADTVYAIAELAYLGGKRTELTNKSVALDLYSTAVLHAYLYLFDPALNVSQNQYDPQFRGACDLYNTALESALRLVRGKGTLQPGRAWTIETASRRIDVDVVLRHSGWHQDEFDRFEFASDYEVNGLRNHYHTYGLGVPLIAVRKQHENQDPTEKYYPPQLSFPVTAFLRLEPIVNSHDTQPERLRAVLELHDPLVTSEISVADRTVPLESDITTPLAYFLSQPEFDDTRLSTTGLLNPDAAKKLGGLYVLEPFDPDKIPVVLVHGLWSSPITWMEMFNDLRSSPEIRDHYQFWFYMYPTGQPFWFSAAQMREDLASARSALDPQGNRPALDQMVLVGHSMGGLVSMLQTVDSGDKFWGIMTDQPFGALRASEDVKSSLSHTLFFHPSPSVSRVITIGTPHRGSEFANDLTRWLGQKLIAVPSRLLSGRQQLERDNPGFFREKTLLNITTSIDSLAPDSPVLPVLLAADRAPWVTYHNIVGDVPDEGLFGRVSGDGDGVVSLASASLGPDRVASQITVPSDHVNVHRHPRAILEVRRILMEHLDQLRTGLAVQHSIERLPLPASGGAAAVVTPGLIFGPP